MTDYNAPRLAFCDSETIAAWQSRALVEEIAYLAAHSPFYRQLFAQHGIQPSKVQSLDDLRTIPTTAKSDLQNHAAQFLCVPPAEISDYVTTSGTLGEPVTFALTESDLDRLAYNEAQSFAIAGCTAADRLQLMTTLDRRFMAGMAYYLGARRLRMGVARVGNGIPALQWDTLLHLQPTTCIVVPSFLLSLVDFAEEHGIDWHASSLRRAICIGEGIRDPQLHLSPLGVRIHERWPELALYSTYASTEMQSAFTECQCQCGGHLQPELLIAEFLDDNGEPVPEGTPGELVITTIGVRGMPLLRFRTGDICQYYTEPCACGRHSLRVSPLFGRKGQMIKFKGTSLYPPALYDVLDNVDGIETYVVEAYTNAVGTDEVIVRIAVQAPSDDFVKQLKDLFRARVRVAPTIEFATREYIEQLRQPPKSRKVQKFIDRRN